MMRSSVLAAAVLPLLLLAAPLAAQTAPRQPSARAAPQVPPSRVTCEGAFAADSSHDRLVQIFGAANVAAQDIDGPEGSTLKASVVFPRDRARRLEVVWHEEDKRRRPSNIGVKADGTGWTFPFDLRAGATLADLERLNGGPFKLSGFAWDYGGAVTDWGGGALARLPGGCFLTVRLAWDEATPEPAKRRVSGDRTFSSSSADIRAVRPRISEMAVGWPE